MHPDSLGSGINNSFANFGGAREFEGNLPLHPSTKLNSDNCMFIIFSHMYYVTQYSIQCYLHYFKFHTKYARTHRVLICYTYLIAAAGTQPHPPISVPSIAYLLHNQVVSYHPACINRTADVGHDMHTCSDVFCV